jgi:DnaJ domain
MGLLLGALAVAGLTLVLRWYMRADAAVIARALHYAPAALSGLAGLIALLFGRPQFAFILFSIAAVLFGRAKQKVGDVTGDSGKTSVVRTVWLEMELDHDTGNMDGMMQQGPQKGVPFSMMDKDGLLAVQIEISGDAESAALFETYLDRVMPLWRKNTDTRADEGLRSAPGSSAMSQKEAYDILGLDPGAGPEMIRKAHRRLMQRVHPDLGGSDFLAARINAAKDLLLSAHRKT